MANVLNDEKKQQLIALGRLGWSLRRIEEEIGVRRETASAYMKAAGVPVRPPGRWGRRSTAKPAIKVSTDSVMDELRSSADSSSKPAIECPPTPIPVETMEWTPQSTPSASACEPHKEFIEQRLGLGRNAMAIWQDLVDTYGYEGKYASVRRFVVRLRGQRTPEPHCVIHTAPGEEAQVDYGEGPMVRDPQTGKYRRTRLFVMTLGFSRKSVRLLVFSSSSRVWAELHETAFRRLGGAPRVVVLDNLREGVLKPDVYDPELNPLYRDVLKHHGVVALPCRVRDPNRKGKCESSVGHAQRTPLQGLRFDTIEEAQAYLDHWESRWADTRIHGTTKRQVLAMFAEEQPLLHPLPAEPFRYYEYGQRVVHLDGHVEVAGSYYSVPLGLIGNTVHVQWNQVLVRIMSPHTGTLLREHVRQKKGAFRTKEQDRPSRAPMSTERILIRAGSIGRHALALCQAMHQRHGETGIRRILGVIALAKKHGPAVVDEGCAAALDLGAPEYRFVKRYLQHRPPPPLTLRQVDPLIRSLTHYRDLIDRKTQGDPE
jgi:transposase